MGYELEAEEAADVGDVWLCLLCHKPATVATAIDGPPTRCAQCAAFVPMSVGYVEPQTQTQAKLEEVTKRAHLLEQESIGLRRRIERLERELVTERARVAELEDEMWKCDEPHSIDESRGDRSGGPEFTVGVHCPARGRTVDDCHLYGCVGAVCKYRDGVE